MYGLGHMVGLLHRVIQDRPMVDDHRAQLSACDALFLIPLTKFSRGLKLYYVGNLLSNCPAGSCERGVVTINTLQRPLLKTGALYPDQSSPAFSTHTVVTID